MNSISQAQPLNATEQLHLQRIEQALSEQRGGAPDIHSLDGFAILLANAAPAPDRRMAARLEQRLLHAFQAPEPGKLTDEHLPRPKAPSPLGQRFGGLAVRLAAFMLLALLLATALSPPLRAAAQAWIGQVGNLLISGEQTQAERDFGRVEQLDMAQLPGLPAEAAELAEISAQVDFALLVPTDLPQELSYLAARVVAREEGAPESAILSYGGAYPLAIEQTAYRRAPLEELAIGSDAVPQLVIVRGELAYWLENIPGGLGGILNEDAIVTNPALYYYSMLLWQEGDVLYRISGLGTRQPTLRMDAPADGATQQQPGLTLDTALHIAESMAPYQD